MSTSLPLTSTMMDSPVGPLTLTAHSGGLTGVYFDGGRHGPRPAAKPGKSDILAAAQSQLEAYFAGRRLRFDVGLAPQGTLFQQQVWAHLLRIPYGETATYGWIGAQLGKPSAARAVGAAVGRNPLSIIVPCHRIIGATGGLTGFAGGLDRKAFLLELEGGADPGRTRR